MVATAAACLKSLSADLHRGEVFLLAVLRDEVLRLRGAHHRSSTVHSAHVPPVQGVLPYRLQVFLKRQQTRLTSSDVTKYLARRSGRHRVAAALA